ncbi:SGNH/GDSL hydrolase family protein [Nocardioides antri]|uniref:SGNH/GDSL hydrolase family protein n=1 Tax=Nocardioides antri TaxID=2607659 RepID=UPI001CB735B6|nr:SGNH/GDSL hydrolase family protein [Nocardioides antri]
MPHSDLTEATDPYCLSPGGAGGLLAGAPWRRFGVIGDSLSAGVGDPSPGYAPEGWPERVATTLRLVAPDLEYSNIARVGATTVDALRDQVDRIRAFAPHLLHVPSGPNDLLTRTPDYPAIERNLDRLYAQAADTGAQLMTFTLGRAFVVPTFADWTDRIRRLNDIVRSVASTRGAVVVEMWDHPINDRPNLVSADGIHFSSSGQAVLAAEYVKSLAALIRDHRAVSR